MAQTLLITGGSGLLALNWALAMRERLDIVLGLHARETRLQGVRALRLDLETLEGLQRVLAELRPAAVIHTAGMTNVDACERDAARARHVNVALAVNVARACAQSEVPLAHISTDHLFSRGVQRATETEPVTPTNVYGRTKADAESAVLDAHPQALVIRTNFYGWGPSYRLSFSDVILTALRGRRSVSLFQDVFYTPMLIEAVVRTVHELLDARAHGIFHVVGNDRLSKLDFGLHLAERFGLDAGLIRAGRLVERTELVRRPHEMSLSNEKTTRLLGRSLGGIDDHLHRLLQQEELGSAREVRDL